MKITTRDGRTIHISRAFIALARRCYIGVNGYLYTPRKTLLHRVIMQARRGQIVDHVNGDPLDNRRINLRFVSNTDNVRCRHHQARHNTSGFPGVSYTFARGSSGQKYHLSKPWFAKITVNRRQIQLGRYAEKDQAATAYSVATKHFFGKFHPRNIPKFQYDRKVAATVRAKLS